MKRLCLLILVLFCISYRVGKSVLQDESEPLSATHNPCKPDTCNSDSQCVVRTMSNCSTCVPLAVCVNICELTSCPNGHTCKTIPGPCGNSSCEPMATCTNQCLKLNCPRQRCTVIADKCYSPPCEQIVTCGEDPCTKKACSKRELCYVEKVDQSCKKPPCNVKAVCANPCKFTKCPGGQSCHLEDTLCEKPPCDMAPVCAKPCAKECPQSQKCFLQEQFCYQEPCNPIPKCKYI